MSRQKFLFPESANPSVDARPEDLLSPKPITEDYAPWGAWGGLTFTGFINRNRPPFTFYTVSEMLTDPRVHFGLMLIKGPIVSKAKFKVDISRTDVGEFIQKNLRRFWLNSAVRILKALEWGYSGAEVFYKYDSETGRINFDTVKDLQSLDCRPVTNEGHIIGFMLRNRVLSGTPVVYENWNGKKPPSDKTPADPHEQGNKYLGFPKAMYHIHSRDRNPFFGLSRLFGAHVPWWEQWSEDGYRQLRRLWFVKNCFEGGVMYHPMSTIATKQGAMSARDYARELIEKKRSGGTLTLPNTPGPDGNGRAWEYLPPTGNPVPAGLLDYGQLLRDEVLEGMGIPSEVVQASGETGFGSASGRQVPQMAFYSTLQEVAQWLVHDFDRQVLRYLVMLNFGYVPYDIEVESLMDEGQIGAHPNDPNAPDNPLAEPGVDPTNPEDDPNASLPPEKNQ